MKTASLVLDFYDDSTGELLKRSFPSADSLPDVIKEAHILTTEERDVLRDEAYALILVNEGKALRKFACVDAGNTLLSAMYFSENAESLPEEAQKVAAANIIAACEQFGIEVPSLEKVARRVKPPDASNGGAMRRRDSFSQPTVGDEADWAARTNITSVRGGADSGRVIPTASQMKTASEDQKGENKEVRIGAGAGAAGGATAATLATNKNIKNHVKSKEFKQNLRHDLNAIKDSYKGPPTGKYGVRLPKLLVNGKFKREALNAAKKEGRDVARGMRVVSGIGGAVGGLAVGGALGYGAHKLKKHLDKKTGEQVNYLDSHHKLNPGSKPSQKVANVVDVSLLSPPVKIKKASAENLALGHYPLDSFGDVEKAALYFDDNYKAFTPSQRREFAVKTAARASELGISVSPLLARYGSTEMAPDVDAHLANRRAVCPDHEETWDALQVKAASVSPEKFVELLSEADEAAGVNWLYDGEVADPYYATFGGDTVKEANAAWSWMSPTGDYVNMEQLKKLALNGRPIVEKQFDSSIASAFSKNPMVIFDSLPTTHKTILARLATSEFDGLSNN